MSFINYHSKEINCKVVYYGPGLSGKTTNVQHLYKKTQYDAKGELLSLGNENERTIFFDFLPLDIGEINGFKTRLHLYTVPGQVFYEASRKLVLRGVDGLIFVADSQLTRRDANKESIEDLERQLLDIGIDSSKLPMIMQWNKRDVSDLIPVDLLDSDLNKHKNPTIEAVATKGIGVFESLKLLSKLVLANVRESL